MTSANATNAGPRLDLFDPAPERAEDVIVRLVDQMRGRGTHPMLERVDPYGSLIFSLAEMPQFLSELARLPTSTAQDVEAIRRLEDLARKGAADPATELHLDGD
ncbi:hypothetical protein [Microbispora rosea]|uniref:hypothetical protein n=1 Tax=Microbispora rosea TaxID=58117 RepID=UPI0034366C8B